MATILVTGGAGYVGSHCCLALTEAGHRVVVFDNFSNGHRAFAQFGPLEEGDVRDRARLDAVLAAHRPNAVLHCAALIEVGESVKFPEKFHDVNVGGTRTLLDAMGDAGVGVFVFSSTCALYGAPRYLPLDEKHPLAPLSPYGETKMKAEADSRARAGMKYAHLRYFNAAGAASDRGLGERHEPETHALPLALFAALGRRDGFKVFGADYETPDGSCLRDYVHVLDLADAHVAAIERLLDGGESLAANLGGGDGVSVLGLLRAIERVTGRAVPHTIAPRREGDSPALVADNTLARRELGWSPKHDIDRIIADAWTWHSEVEPKLFG